MPSCCNLLQGLALLGVSWCQLGLVERAPGNDHAARRLSAKCRPSYALTSCGLQPLHAHVMPSSGTADGPPAPYKQTSARLKIAALAEMDAQTRGDVAALTGKGGSFSPPCNSTDGTGSGTLKCEVNTFVFSLSVLSLPFQCLSTRDSPAATPSINHLLTDHPSVLQRPLHP